MFQIFIQILYVAIFGNLKQCIFFQKFHYFFRLFKNASILFSLPLYSDFSWIINKLPFIFRFPLHLLNFRKFLGKAQFFEFPALYFQNSCEFSHFSHYFPQKYPTNLFLKTKSYFFHTKKKQCGQSIESLPNFNCTHLIDQCALWPNDRQKPSSSIVPFGFKMESFITHRTAGLSEKN